MAGLGILNDSISACPEPRIQGSPNSMIRAEDGHVYVKVRGGLNIAIRNVEHDQNLAQFIRTHERSLAAATQKSQPFPRIARLQSVANATSASQSLTALLYHGTARFFSQSSMANCSTLTLDPHHLYYLMTQFDELGIASGVGSGIREHELSDTHMR